MARLHRGARLIEEKIHHLADVEWQCCTDDPPCQVRRLAIGCDSGRDLVRHYKPDREMYVSAPHYLDLKPEEVMVCAAHVPDLQAARSCGLRTGFIYRPNEYGGGPVGVPDKAKPGDFDVVSVSIIDLAHQMGA